MLLLFQCLVCMINLFVNVVYMKLLVFILGTLFGSFFLVIGTRLPLKDNVITGRSRCDNCYHELKWLELIPVLSFLFLGGKCRYCHQKITIEHLIVEIITGLLFLYGYHCYGLTVSYGIYLTILSLTIIIFISDMKYMIILDSPLVLSIILIIFFRYFELGLINTIYSIIYGILLFIVMFLIKKLGDYMFKKESLGGGDIKLAFLMGLVLGYPGIGFRLGLISIIFASFLALPYAIGSLYIHKKNELPFGPFLIASVLIIYLFIDKFTNLLILFLL